MIKKYKFKTGLWLYPGKISWHFITLPVETAENIDYFFSMSKRGWGSLPVSVTVGKTSWKTSIFPYKKGDSYLLPIKKEVREKEGIKARDEVELTIQLTG